MASQTVFHGLAFSGRFGPDDLPVPAVCPEHGVVTVHIPLIHKGAGRLLVNDSTGDCPVPGCGQEVEIINTSIEFQRRAVRKLIDTKVSRQQARRFKRAVEAGSQEKVIRVAGEIAPEVEQVVDQALKTSFPKKAIAWTAWLLGSIASAGITYSAFMTGLDAHLRVIDQAGSVQSAMQEVLTASENSPPDVPTTEAENEENAPDDDTGQKPPDRDLQK